MFKVIKVVSDVFRKHYLKSSPDFQEGFKTAIRLFVIGYENSTQYNWHFEAYKLKKENEELKGIIKVQKEQLKSKSKILNEVTLFNASPAKEYKEYIVDYGSRGSFNIITNMTREDFDFCLYNFNIKKSFNRIDEAKSKLLLYINSQNSLGYRAFKNKNSYNRFLNGRT